jgi:hypothetical protein
LRRGKWIVLPVDGCRQRLHQAVLTGLTENAKPRAAAASRLKFRKSCSTALQMPLEGM